MLFARTRPWGSLAVALTLAVVPHASLAATAPPAPSPSTSPSAGVDATATATATATGTAVPTAPAPPAPAPPATSSPTATAATAPTASAAATRAAARVSCSAPVATPVVDGQDMVVSMPPAAPFVVGRIPTSTWRQPPVDDPSWAMRYRSLRWLPPLAQRAYDDGASYSLRVLVAQALSAHRANPDPGTATRGWDEGTALHRLDHLRCLYLLTRDARLVPLMHANAAVLLGPRYYGPPRFPVHNHGLMANLRLVRAADALGVPAWREVALRRIRHEAPLVFSAMGTSWEQSASYQGHNTAAWNAAARVLEEAGGAAATVTVIRAATARAAQVGSWLTEPDGRLVQIGNSDMSPGFAPLASTQRVFRDDEAGLVVGRWSWTDPATTYYTLRYGPRRRAHGHEDRAGVTWSTAGVRVVVDTGKFTYDARSPWHTYQVGPAGQNVAVPVVRRTAPHSPVRLVAHVVQSRAHGWRFSENLYGPTHSRGVNVNTLTGTLKVDDTYPRGTRFTQTWHLDPAWRLTGRSAQRLTFAHPAGRTLTVATTGRITGVAVGQTNPIAGWQFPSFGQRVPAAQVTVLGSSRAETSFVVR